MHTCEGKRGVFKSAEPQQALERRVNGSTTPYTTQLLIACIDIYIYPSADLFPAHHLPSLAHSLELQGSMFTQTVAIFAGSNQAIFNVAYELSGILQNASKVVRTKSSTYTSSFSTTRLYTV